MRWNKVNPDMTILRKLQRMRKSAYPNFELMEKTTGRLVYQLVRNYPEHAGRSQVINFLKRSEPEVMIRKGIDWLILMRYLTEKDGYLSTTQKKLHKEK